ncbi:MAG: hypothetical protein KIS79_17395 [Burkholderiales bacterium]|jgi:hypothetical protein|nr:hypothetical protein [Burkholderiales bacterium]
MRPPSFLQKRIIAAIYLVFLLGATGNYYLGWGMFGQADRVVLSVVMLLGLIAVVRYAPRMMEEMRARQAELRDVQDAAERARDKANDVAEADRLRWDIGMPPNKSLERGRER